MQEFTSLRRIALERREKAIEAAKTEYAETIGRILLLERDLGGSLNKPIRRVNEAVAAVIPEAGEFTISDIMASLVALEPHRQWRADSVAYNIGILQKRGVIRCVKRHKHSEQAAYMRVTKDTPAEPLRLLEAIQKALKNGPMNLTELTMAVLAAGYETTMRPKVLRKEIATAMRRAGLKEEEGGKWTMT